MDCPSCGSANPKGNNFCGGCGARLPVCCAVCGVENPSNNKFCGGCGAALAVSARAFPALGASTTTAPQGVEPPASNVCAERRQLTVMFCDVVGSTALSARLDPEDLREVIGGYHRCVSGTVRRFDGFVAKYMGDGVLVYFGYPQAHEEDAERAVRAGLAVVDALGRLHAPERLRVRIGIETGLVVVGDLIAAGGGHERGVVGETPNLAAHLQAMAEADAVVIGPRTRRLIGDLFEVRDLGLVERVYAYQVLRESTIESRFEALHGAAPTPLVGRDEEIELLLRRWRRATSGEGQAVLLSGEPGIGKSRLANAVQDRLGSEALVTLRYFCSARHTASALHPFITQLEHAAGFVRGDTPEAKIDKLVTLLAPGAPPTEDQVLLAEQLSLPIEARFPPLQLTPQRKKEKTFEALLRQLEASARQRPVLMLFEDVHWIDPSSRELLDLVVERLPQLQVLLVVTFRPEFQPTWAGQAHVTTLVLNPLDRGQGAALVESIVGSKELPHDVVTEIIDRTDGVPLFVEELTKAVLEAGEGSAVTALARASSRELTVPATLHASLMARLDRLGLAAKEVAQVGAAIGREFSYELLAAVAERDETELRTALEQLVAAGLAFRRGMPPQASYLFKHALVQDAAYGTLLRGMRRQLHARIAETLTASDAEIDPALLAQHWAEAGATENAIAAWLASGRRAMARGATGEAITASSRGLEQVKRLPESSDPPRHELELQIALGDSYAAERGFGAMEAGQAFLRARVLCEQLADRPRLYRVLNGLCINQVARAEPGLGRDVAEDLLHLVQGERPGLKAEGHRLLGITLYYGGELTSARAQLETALALRRRDASAPHTTVATLEPRVATLRHLAEVMFLLGYPEQGLKRSREAVELAQHSVHPFTLAFAMVGRGDLHALMRDPRHAHEQAATSSVLGHEHGFHGLEAYFSPVRGWALMEAGEVSDGVAALRHGLNVFRQMGFRTWLPFWLSLAAEALAKVGEINEASSTAAEAVDLVRSTGIGWCEAEVYRVRGIVLSLSARGEDDEVEGLFRRACDIARRQQARAWELRAATSLARLWLDQGKRAEARDLLAPIYGWFTEGLDTPDLKEPKALLDQLCV